MASASRRYRPAWEACAGRHPLNSFSDWRMYSSVFGGESARQSRNCLRISVRKGAVETAPGAGVTCLAVELDVHFKDMRLIGRMQADAEHLDHAQVKGGEPDASGDAAHRVIRAVGGGLLESRHLIGGETAGAGLCGGGEEFGEKRADAAGGGLIDGEGEIDGKQITLGPGQKPGARKGRGGEACRGAGRPERGNHHDRQNQPHGEDCRERGIIQIHAGQPAGVRKERGDSLSADVAKNHSQGSQGHRLGEEKHADMRRGKTDGCVHMNFTGSLGDGAQHGAQDDDPGENHRDDHQTQVARGGGLAGIDRKHRTAGACGSVIAASPGGNIHGE